MMYASFTKEFLKRAVDILTTSIGTEDFDLAVGLPFYKREPLLKSGEGFVFSGEELYPGPARKVINKSHEVRLTVEESSTVHGSTQVCVDKGQLSYCLPGLSLVRFSVHFT